MVDTPTAHGAGSYPSTADDGWGPATSVRAGSRSEQRPEQRAARGAQPPQATPASGTAPASTRPSRSDVDARRDPGGWTDPTPAGRPDRSSAARADVATPRRRSRSESTRSVDADDPATRAGVRPAERERGLPAWAALLVLVAIAGVGGLIDAISGTQVRGGFNIGIIVASLVAILLVRHSEMFPVVIAPPIVYAGASLAMLYVRSHGLHDRSELFDAATNWLVYGFPAIAAATAGVLIIAGIRMITRR